jgi:hypothetical protein
MSTITSCIRRPPAQEVFAVAAEPAQHLSVRAPALTALDSRSLMHERPATERVTGVLGQTLAALRKDST